MDYLFTFNGVKLKNNPFFRKMSVIVGTWLAHLGSLVIPQRGKCLVSSLSRSW